MKSLSISALAKSFQIDSSFIFVIVITSFQWSLVSLRLSSQKSSVIEQCLDLEELKCCTWDGSGGSDDTFRCGGGGGVNSPPRCGRLAKWGSGGGGGGGVLGKKFPKKPNGGGGGGTIGDGGGVSVGNELVGSMSSICVRSVKSRSFILSVWFTIALVLETLNGDSMFKSTESALVGVINKVGLICCCCKPSLFFWWNDSSSFISA